MSCDGTNFLKDIEDFIEGDPDPKEKLLVKDYFPKLENYYKTLDIPIIGNPRSIFQRMMDLISGCKIDVLHEFTLELGVKWLNLDIHEENAEMLTKIIRSLRKKYHYQPRKIHIRAYYFLLVYSNFIPRIKSLEKLMVIKKMRSLSGIISVSVIIDPYPKWLDEETGKIVKQRFTCRHDCHFCPTQVDEKGQQVMPKSYLLREPACARGFKCKFSAVEQIYTRLFSYFITGHPVTKIEIIVLGGTWSEVNVNYQRQFIRDLYYACNTFPLGTFREPLSLEREIEINETSKSRIIGLTLETRPDSLLGIEGDDEIKRLRSYGCTRLQLGIQSIYDDVLKLINRGHTIRDGMMGIKKWKNAGGKVICHFMPDLPGSTPEMDKKMWDFLVESPDLQPDEIKVYPCQTTPFTKIEKWQRSGKYTPYSDTNLDTLIDVIMHLKRKSIKIPWMRFTRVVRDIPNNYILAGNPVTNLRQVIDRKALKLGVKCWCTRCREVKNKEIVNPKLVIHKYKASDSIEYFLEFVNGDDNYTLYGFLRLRIPEPKNKIIFQELICKGMVRELHVYGKVLNINTNEKSASQHKGLGRKLLQKAEELSKKHRMLGVSVISGVGVRNYYRKFGYTLSKNGYMVKNFTNYKPYFGIAMFLVWLYLYLSVTLPSNPTF